ncbi:PWI domain-containing protein [Myriangium duriaei CBS 260.36]|uniref:PWI domain-containing protein n=1 Tax=Myriangium duriaei CBS 260.36 TaxID=1168546 RepID=A0A9P4JBD6_9PEZI|nr:PWI domain-containing protein [Myriangium duriaei CBS 260.36]
MPPIITNVDEKALRTTKHPPEFDQKVDTTKINLPVIKNWAAGELKEILEIDDDVVIGLLFDLLDVKQPKIKSIQQQLSGFLGDKSASFCKKLWNYCLSAQSNETGVPPQLLEAKKAELIQERVRQFGSLWNFTLTCHSKNRSKQLSRHVAKENIKPATSVTWTISDTGNGKTETIVEAGEAAGASIVDHHLDVVVPRDRRPVDGILLSVTMVVMNTAAVLHPEILTHTYRLHPDDSTAGALHRLHTVDVARGRGRGACREIAQATWTPV